MEMGKKGAAEWLAPFVYQTIYKSIIKVSRQKAKNLVKLVSKDFLQIR